jgi:ribosome-binding factor A
MNQIIEITVTPDGQTRVETRGFSGAGCREASRFIEEALGKRASERTTPEFFQVADERQRLQEGGR